MKKVNGNGHIEIEKGVPVPAYRKPGNAKYPWREMKVGDSFLFPPELQKNHTYHNTRYANKVLKPKKFMAQSTPEGVRCWRTA